MPIFHDIDCPSFSRSPPPPESGGYEPTMRRPSEESIRTEFCDGPVPDSDGRATSPVEKVVAAINDTKLETSDRAELIERIKRGESPTWVPSKTVSQIISSLPPNLCMAADMDLQQTECFGPRTHFDYKPYFRGHTFRS